VRHKAYATPWVDYLMVSSDEMEEIVDGTGWHVERVLRDDVFYTGLITKRPS
jgi:hypothetical protein